MKFFSNLFCSQLIRSLGLQNTPSYRRPRVFPAVLCVVLYWERMSSPALPATSGTIHEPSLPQRLLRFWSRVRLSFPWMVGVAFGVRVLCIIVMHTYKVRTTED